MAPRLLVDVGMLFAGLTVAAFVLAQAASPPSAVSPPRPLTVPSIGSGPGEPGQPRSTPGIGSPGSPPSPDAAGAATERPIAVTAR